MACGAAEWVADGVRAECVVVADAEAEAEVRGVVDAGADVCAVAEAEARAELDVPAAGLLALLVARLLAAGRVVEDRAPAGDGVRVAG